MNLETVEQRIKSLEARVKKIEEGCCGSSALEERIKTNFLLNQLQSTIESHFREESDKMRLIEARLNTLYRILYIGTGIVVAVQFFGIADKFKILIGS